jgi:hypothetical protein
MPWLSVNPRVESQEDIKAAADHHSVAPEDISPKQLAIAYNAIESKEEQIIDQLIDGVFNAFSDD